MKLIRQIILLLLVTNSYGQKFNQTAEWHRQLYENLDRGNFKDSLIKYDFRLLWTTTQNSLVYGFIGTNFERLRIKIVSAKKDSLHNDTYNIIGKTMEQNEVSQFNGSIRIDSIMVYKRMHWGVDDEFKNRGIKREGILIAKYHFARQKGEKDLGTLEGTVLSSWLIDKEGSLKLDTLEYYSDFYSNNQFVGALTRSNGEKVICNWGDYRAPYCGDLDIGAGEFSPNEKYIKNGWLSVRDAYDYKPDSAARHEEERQWWRKKNDR